MSYKVKRMLLVVGFVMAALMSYAGSCEESGEYRGKFGDGLGIADKIECPEGGCD